jgi:hypothetical protein
MLYFLSVSPVPHHHKESSFVGIILQQVPQLPDSESPPDRPYFTQDKRRESYRDIGIYCSLGQIRDMDKWTDQIPGWDDKDLEDSYSARLKSPSKVD